jgi:hypothetical protein
MHEVISKVIDAESWMEVHKDYAENIIVGFARLGGQKHWYCSESTRLSRRGTRY